MLCFQPELAAYGVHRYIAFVCGVRVCVWGGRGLVRATAHFDSNGIFLREILARYTKYIYYSTFGDNTFKI